MCLAHQPTPHLLMLTGGAGGLSPLAVAAPPLLVPVPAAAAPAVVGGGADSFSFSALASSSLPRSTHILSCVYMTVR